MFKYTPANISALKATISEDRFSTYLDATGGDEQKALQLYVWNTKISAAFYIPLQGLEICLRNKMHTALSGCFGSAEWYDNIKLNSRGMQTIDNAKEQVRRLHRAIDAPHVVAELSFGFWLSLLNRSYHQSLWIPCLGRSFPNAGKTRADIHRELDHLRILRNRVAHHEPIFTRHLEKDYDSIIRAIGWMCQITADWVHTNNMVGATLQEQPKR